MNTEASPEAMSIAWDTAFNFQSSEHSLSTIPAKLKSIVVTKPSPYQTIPS